MRYQPNANNTFPEIHLHLNCEHGDMIGDFIVEDGGGY